MQRLVESNKCQGAASVFLISFRLLPGARPAPRGFRVDRDGIDPVLAANSG